MNNCICHVCERAGYNTHDAFEVNKHQRFNPSVQSKDIEPERISERAEDLADGRRPEVFEHRHVAIGKIRENY